MNEFFAMVAQPYLPFFTSASSLSKIAFVILSAVFLHTLWS
jgi:hypothetical protein